MKQKTLLCLLVVFLPFLGIAQTAETTLTKKQVRQLRPSYLVLGSGFNYGRFRDFATSPLFYSGLGATISLSALNTDAHYESQFAFTATGDLYMAMVGDNFTNSIVGSFYYDYSSLYQIKALSNDRFNLKAGGMFSLAMNVRENDAFMNNAYGMEFIPTFFGAVKTSFDVSRRNAKDRKIWFLKFHREPRRRTLSYQLNTGFINSSYRNGYVYIGQSALLNEYKAFGAYGFSVFSGFRMNSSLDYTLYMKNCNALRFSYVWDAYKTGGDFDKLEFASHSFKFSLLFNTK